MAKKAKKNKPKPVIPKPVKLPGGRQVNPRGSVVNKKGKRII